MAVSEYEISQGQLTYFTSFGSDPLNERPDLVTKRMELFYSQGFSYEFLFTDVASSNGEKFKDGIVYFCEITTRLANKTILFH